MNIPDIKNEKEEYVNFSYFTKGGMGEIYKGIEIKTNREIVLKLIPIEDPAYENLLKTEIDVSISFNHPNIVNTRNAGKIDIEGGNYFYIIQDFYIKGNLKKYIKPNILIDDCFAMIFDILNGMKEIHTKIVHRDLKPENILIDSSNHLRISDFGLAKYIDEKTRTKSFKGAGTYPYMAPECWTNDTNSIAMDIYALGIIFFEIFTGHLPFVGKTEQEWRDLHLFTQMPDILDYRQDCSIKISQIIKKMTNKRISDRYKSIDEILSAFKEADKIQKTNSQEAERLAMLGSLTLQKISTEELKKKKEEEEQAAWNKNIDFHVDELYSRIKVIVDNVNARLESDKVSIKYVGSTYQQGPEGMTISFINKAIKFSFSGYDSVKIAEEKRKKIAQDDQRRQYGGMILYEYDSSSFFMKNNIIILGLAETNYKFDQNEIGFNLALVKKENEMYGTWYKISFTKNQTPPEPCFGLDMSIIFDKFDEANRSMFHKTKFSVLEDKDLSFLIEKIM